MELAELPRAVDGIVKTTDCKGHVFMYLDGNKVKVSGNLDLPALLPMFGPALLEILKRKL